MQFAFQLRSSQAVVHITNAMVSRDTLWRLERGDPTVSIGTLATAAFALQLHDRLSGLAAPDKDTLGLALDEQRLPQRIRRPRG